MCYGGFLSNYVRLTNVIKGFPPLILCVFSPTEEDEILEWFIYNFNVSYHGNRAPFGFYVHAAWFLVSEAHFGAYLKFVDYLQELDDVFLVSFSNILTLHH